MGINTLVGKNHKSQLLTIVDKACKVVTIRRLKSKSSEAVIERFQDVHGSTFYEFKTITADNGTEFASHEEILKITRADFYFAKPYSSWERGLNKHTNELIRRFLPKGTDFDDVSDEELARIEHILNTRRRESLRCCVSCGGGPLIHLVAAQCGDILVKKKNENSK